jgi:hypothetical protein
MSALRTDRYYAGFPAVAVLANTWRWYQQQRPELRILEDDVAADKPPSPSGSPLAGPWVRKAKGVMPSQPERIDEFNVVDEAIGSHGVELLVASCAMS